MTWQEIQDGDEMAWPGELQLRDIPPVFLELAFRVPYVSRLRAIEIIDPG